MICHRQSDLQSIVESMGTLRKSSQRANMACFALFLEFHIYIKPDMFHLPVLQIAVRHLV